MQWFLIKGEYQVVYANTDASKTSMTRQVLRTSIASEGSNQLMARVKQALPQLKLEAKRSRNQGILPVLVIKYKLFTSMIPVLIGFVVFFFVFLISGIGTF